MASFTDLDKKSQPRVLYEFHEHTMTHETYIGGPRTTYGCQFFLPSTWGLEFKLSFVGFTAGTVTR